MRHFHLTLSWRRPLLYRNQSIDLQSKNQWTGFYMITAPIMKELNLVANLSIFVSLCWRYVFGKKFVLNINLIQYRLFGIFLTHLFPMHPFCTPIKHQKVLRFSDVFRVVEKGFIGSKWIKVSMFCAIMDKKCCWAEFVRENVHYSLPIFH